MAPKDATGGGLPAGLSAHYRASISKNEEEKKLDSDSEENVHGGSTFTDIDPNPFRYIGGLYRTYGWRLLAALFFTEHLSKGLAYNLHFTGIDFMLKKYNTPAPDIQIFKAFIGIPWGLKPMVGMMSDRLPIFGYRKLPYMLIVTLMGIGGCCMVGFLPAPATPVKAIVGGMFLIAFGVAMNDLLAEAKYSEVLQETPKDGPGVVSYVWLGVFFCSMLGTLLQGPVIEHLGAEWLYIICLVPVGLCLVPILMNWLQDEYMDQAKREATWAKVNSQPELIFLAGLLVFFCAIISVVNLSGLPKVVNAVIAVIVVISSVSAFQIFLTPVIGKVNSYCVLEGTLAISIDGAVFYFFTDSATENPGGPNFSIFFYTTGLGIVVDLCNLIGIWTYTTFMSKWNYRSLFMCTNIILSIAHLWGVLIFSRYNLKLGIPDKTFALTAAAMHSITKMWMWMPSMLLTAQLCPKGSEATMFALLAGCANLGHSCSSMIGAYALEAFGVTPTGEVGDVDKFKNLWQVALMSSLLPAFTLLMIPLCIPDAKQSEKVLHHRLHSAIDDSPFRRWLGRSAGEATEETGLTA